MPLAVATDRWSEGKSFRFEITGYELVRVGQPAVASERSGDVAGDLVRRFAGGGWTVLLEEELRKRRGLGGELVWRCGLVVGCALGGAWLTQAELCAGR